MDQGSLDLELGDLTFSGLQWNRSAGGIAVLCLHGFPQRCTSWAPVASTVAAAGVRVVALDQRGYSPGARPSAIDDYVIANLVADVVAMIDALGGRVHLVGHDWGGVVGWQVAARHPDRVASWTAVSTPGTLALKQVLARDVAQRERFGYIKAFRHVGRAEQALLADGGARLAALYGGSVDPRRVRADVEFFTRPGVLTAALAWYRAMSPSDADGVGPVTVPTAFVWGSADVAFGREAAELTGNEVDAPYRFVPLEGASHWLPDERPDVIADVVLDQLR